MSLGSITTASLPILWLMAGTADSNSWRVRRPWRWASSRYPLKRSDCTEIPWGQAGPLN